MSYITTSSFSDNAESQGAPPIPQDQGDGPTPVVQGSAPRLTPTVQQTASSGDITRATLILAATRPWVRFLSILGFIGVALGALNTMFTAFGAIASGAAMVGMLMFLFMIPITVLYAMPWLYLSRYASNISELQASGSMHTLEAALGAQKSFWKFMGIFTIVAIGLGLILFLLMMAGGFAMMASMPPQ